jgi:hypothetical protein
MGGWTLPDLWDLDDDVQQALAEWIQRDAKGGEDEDSIDMDALISARQEAEPRG